MLLDRLDRDRPTLGLAYHGDQSGLTQHHLSEAVHARGRRWTCRTNRFTFDRINRTYVVDHPVGKVDW